MCLSYVSVEVTDLSDGRKKEDGYLCHSLPMQMLMLCSGEISPSAVSLFSSMNISIGAEYPVKLIMTHCNRLPNNNF